MAEKLIILDRDGVINYDSDDYIKTVDEWQPLPGSMEAIGKLTQAGYTIAVATNQSGIARGYFSVDTLNAMHEKMIKLAAEHGGKFAHIAYCPHGPDDHCDCRKPLPGLIHQIESALNVSAKDCYMVGDSYRDLEAGIAAGMKPVLVRTGKGKRTIEKHPELKEGLVFKNLDSFVLSNFKSLY
ncbi:D-glycero-beta-D-manno-heptose 1,7-bisphosphate 7-phosphatase [Oceaniserpentilla sp. 4NH20-0058]|uniref:D-glycero-beta-D-manno-heptose 1,7-bisphosphate 7-phosphatase n=1 Tax=Oceaniserpentilla sp. 4NH20-0058 TaxID=3127660 RepID=UPI003103174E